MYVLTHNDQVLLGPMRWNSRMFNSTIEDDVDVITNLVPSDENKVPLDLGSGIKIRVALEVHENVTSPRTQMYTGPFWTFTDSVGTATYKVGLKPLSLIQHELLAQAKEERWSREQLGVKIVLRGTEVTIDTSKKCMSDISQYFLLLKEGEFIDWKFPEKQLTLTRAELGSCVDRGLKYIQSQFSWELAITDKINNLRSPKESELILIKKGPVLGKL